MYRRWHQEPVQISEGTLCSLLQGLHMYHVQLEMCSLNPGTCLKLLYSTFLLQIYETVLFFYGASKQDFDARWKSLHSVKEALEDKVINL